MSLENDDQLLLKQKPESRKHSKISYTRDFLLSFSNLDICKKLPSGFNTSILSELEDAAIGTSEWQRSVGGSTFHSSKRGDYASLPPNRLENSASYSRGNSGRWEVRSSGSSNRDRDLHTDPEAFAQDSGRHLATQPRHVWQSEHDGLLGSGAYPRSPGYAGYSAPKARGTSHLQLNRNTEPYNPPRPYKAVPLQRNNNDSRDEETFGSADASEDKAEEERKRRASFELMRKEQHKTFQEKQKQVPDNKKDKLDADIVTLLKNTVDSKNIVNRNGKADDFLPSQKDSSKSSTTQASMPRPLVPPGFASATLDKNPSFQPSSTSFASEDSVTSIQDIPPLDGTRKSQENGNQSDPNIVNNSERNGLKSISNHILNDNEKVTFQSSGLEVNKHSVESQSIAHMVSGLQTANEVWEEDHADIQKQEARSDVKDSFGHENSISLLEKLFGSALSRGWDIEPSGTEILDIKRDEEILKPERSDSSKYTGWFIEEDKNLVEDVSSKNLLALIVNNEKSPASKISNDNANELVSPSLPFEIKGVTSKFHGSSATSLMVGKSEQYHQNDKPGLSPTVLRCEDLEQFILADAKDSSSTHQHSTDGPLVAPEGKNEKFKADVHDHASKHLLSLLQKSSTKENDVVPVASPKPDTGFFERISMNNVNSSLKLGVAEEATYCNSEIAPNSDKNLTLEALFGAAFMSELKSADAPVSVQRAADDETIGTAVPSSLALPFRHADPGFISSNSVSNQYEKSMHVDTMHFHHNPEANAHYILGPELNPLNTLSEGPKLGGTGFEEGALDFHLPEEDSLIIVSDSLDSVTSDTLPLKNTSKTKKLLPENTREQLNNKMLKDLARDSVLILDGPPPYDVVGPDPLYYHLQGRKSSQLPHVNNQVGPLFPELDDFTNRSQQMKFIGPDGMHHNSHQNFPSNIAPNNSLSHAGAPLVDPAMHHWTLPHMPIPGNFPPKFPIQGFPRGLPLSHPINHMQGYVPEMNNVHNIPLHQQQPNYGAFGMGMPGPVVGGGGSNHPDAFQMLVDMELRANAKNVRPGFYGPKYDMNFRYR